MKIQKSAQDYLEAMLMLREEKGFIRSVDIAEKLAVSKPSVSVAVKNFRENGYVEMAPDGSIALTEKGLSIAQEMYSRHRMLTDFFVRLGVSPETAQEDACKIEHDLSEETYRALIRHSAEFGEAEK